MRKIDLIGKKVIIFDMDGTLIDSVGIWNSVDRDLISRIKDDFTVTPDEGFIQNQRDETLRRYSTDANPYLKYAEYLKVQYQSDLSAEEIIKLRYAIASDYLKHKIDYKQNADILLKKLKRAGFMLVIATTTKKSNMDIYRICNTNIRSKAPLDEYFSLIYTREDVAKIKPSPQVHQMIMQKLGVSSRQCLVFEDSIVGIEAAKRAGIEVVGIYDDYSKDDMAEIEKQADYYFKDFSAVIEAIDI